MERDKTDYEGNYFFATILLTVIEMLKALSGYKDRKWFKYIKKNSVRDLSPGVSGVSDSPRIFSSMNQKSCR